MSCKLPQFKFHSLSVATEQHNLTSHLHLLISSHLFQQNKYLRLKLTFSHSLKNFLTSLCILGYNSNSCASQVNIFRCCTKCAFTISLPQALSRRNFRCCLHSSALWYPHQNFSLCLPASSFLSQLFSLSNSY